MSELDLYLLATLFGCVSAFYMGLSGRLLELDRKPHIDENGNPTMPNDLVCLATYLAFFVALGYYIAWLDITNQPIWKLVPIFVLSFISASAGSTTMTPSLNIAVPTAGIFAIPGLYHAFRYTGFI